VSSTDFANAYYIKLGRAGIWEADSIDTGKMRIGWREQSIKDINSHRWDFIEGQLRTEHKDKPASVATTDLNGLKIIAESVLDDIWVTFYQAKLWWARLTGPVEQDEVSKFRHTVNPWSDHTENGRLLIVNDLPGKISQLQGFRGTVCRVRYPDLLRRTLNGTRSEIATAISDQRAKLADHLTNAIKELHWKDFEILVDLVFRAAGWVRVSVLGQHAKAYDLELREPITGERYIVQVKSRAGVADLNTTISSFSPEDYHRIFFVIHSPRKNLADYADIPEHVDIVSPERLAELAMDAGLVGWIEEKVA